jgi:hypothetical protein
MPKEKSISSGDSENRTFRLSKRRLQMLKELSEKLEVTDNACISQAILRMWEREFPEKRNS